MATTTNLQVVLSTAYGDEKTYTIKNPKNDVTLAQVREQFQTVFDNNILLASAVNGDPFKAVKSARKVITERVEIS